MVTNYNRLVSFESGFLSRDILGVIKKSHFPSLDNLNGNVGVNSTSFVGTDQLKNPIYVIEAIRRLL